MPFAPAERLLPANVQPVALAPDGRTVALPGPENDVRLSRHPEGDKVRTLTGHTDAVLTCAFAPRGELLASGGRDHTVRLWRWASGREVGRCTGHTGDVTALAFTPDGSALASASRDGTVRCWHVPSGKLLRTWTVKTIPCHLAFTPDGRGLAMKGWDLHVVLWDARTGAEVWRVNEHESADPRRIPVFEQMWIGQIAFAPDGRLLASATWDGAVCLYDATSGRVARRWEVGEDRGPISRARAAEEGLSVRSIAYAPDGRTLATEARDRKLRLWEVATGQEIRHWHWDQPGLHAVQFTPDGRSLVSVNRDGQVVRWDLSRWPEDGRVCGPPNLRELWADLGTDDAARAYRALATLVAQGSAAVVLLEQTVREPRRADPAQVGRWIAELDDRRFAVRERAAECLRPLVDQAVDELQAALDGKPSLEVRLRLEGLLALRQGWSPEQVQVLRAMQVLSQIGTPEALAVLQRRALGPAADRLTREAQRSLRLATFPRPAAH